MLMTDRDIRRDKVGPFEHTKIKIHRSIQARLEY